MAATFVNHTADTQSLLEQVVKVRSELDAMGSFADPHFDPALSLMEEETALTKALGFALARAAVKQRLAE